MPQEQAADPAPEAKQLVGHDSPAMHCIHYRLRTMHQVLCMMCRLFVEYMKTTCSGASSRRESFTCRDGLLCKVLQAGDPTMYRSVPDPAAPLRSISQCDLREDFVQNFTTLAYFSL